MKLNLLKDIKHISFEIADYSNYLIEKGRTTFEKLTVQELKSVKTTLEQYLDKI